MTPQAAPPKPLSMICGLTKNELDAIEVLGFELYQQGRTEEARTIFDGLIALDTQLYHGYAGRGALALAERKLDEAANWLTQALERESNDPTVHANLGETLLRLGRFDEAAAEFGKSLALDPAGKDPGVGRARAILAGMKSIMENFDRQSSPKQQSEPDSDN
jgi:tetratricopeptide (TPR) repeat protein